MTRNEARLLLWLLAETQGEPIANAAAGRARAAEGRISKAAWQLVEEVARNAKENPVRFALETEQSIHDAKKKRRR